MNASRTAVVTGAASGIGAAVTDALLARGDRVIAVDRVPLEVERARLTAHRQDLADEEGTRELTARIVEENPALDTLVLSAGDAAFAGFKEHAAAFWTRNFTNNATSAIAVVRGLIPGLVRTAQETDRPVDVVFVGAISSSIAFAGAVVFSAAAAALESFADQLHIECHKTGIRVRNLHVGYVVSPMTESIGYGPLDADYQRFRETALLPADVAEVVLYTIDRPRGVHLRDVSLVSTAQGWA